MYTYRARPRSSLYCFLFGWCSYFFGSVDLRLRPDRVPVLFSFFLEKTPKKDLSLLRPSRSIRRGGRRIRARPSFFFFFSSSSIVPGIVLVRLCFAFLFPLAQGKREASRVGGIGRSPAAPRIASSSPSSCRGRRFRARGRGPPRRGRRPGRAPARRDPFYLSFFFFAFSLPSHGPLSSFFFLLSEPAPRGTREKGRLVLKRITEREDLRREKPCAFLCLKRTNELSFRVRECLYKRRRYREVPLF